MFEGDNHFDILCFLGELLPKYFERSRVHNPKKSDVHIIYECASVHPWCALSHPLSAEGEGGVEPPTKFSNEGGSLAGHQLLEGGCNFLINNKI